MPNGAPGQPNIDIVQLLWRWKWLILLGGLLGSGVGFLYFQREIPTYRSTGTIQVYSPKDDSPLRYIGEVGNGKADEMRVISSSAVLSLAVTEGGLKNLPKFQGMTVDQVVSWIRGQGLTVALGSKDPQSTIIDVSFRCTDAELAPEVVQAVIKGYKHFIGSESENLSKEIRDKVTLAEKKLSDKFEKLKKDYREFREGTPLIIVEDKGQDPHAQRHLQYLQEISQNRIKLNRLQAIVEYTQSAKEQRDPESILLMLSQIRAKDIYSPIAEAAESRKFNDLQRQDLSQADKIEDSTIFELESKLKELTQQYDTGHPDVKRLTRQIESYKEKAEEIRKREEERIAAFAKEMSENSTTTIDPKERMEKVLASMQDEVLALTMESENLEKLANEELKQSRALQGEIAELELKNQELETTGNFRKDLSDFLAKAQITPDSGRKTMKPLDSPRRGTLVGPFRERYLMMGAFAGAALFMGLAYLLEAIDRSFRSPEDIAHELGVPILAHIPLGELKPSDRKDENVDLSLVTVHRGRSAQSEAYRGVRTGLYFNNRNGDCKVIQVTSPVPGDGKSTTAANLAVTMAQTGRRTLLLDADFRRPRVSKLMGTREDVGVTSVIAGNTELVDAVQPTSIENLFVLACGKRPSNPAELLSSVRFKDLLTLLREKFDYVVIDSPPLLAVSDPANVAAHVDGVVLTLRLRRNLKPIAGRAVDMLRSVDANLIGVVVNGVSGRDGYGSGGYRYGSSSYGYGGKYGGRGYGAQGAYGYGYGNSYGYGGTYGYGYGGDYGVREYHEEEPATAAQARPKTVTRTARTKKIEE